MAAPGDLIEWLANEARLITDGAALVEALGTRLIAAGVPIARITTGVPLLHPILDTSSVQWEPGGPANQLFWRMDPENWRMLANSPLKIVYGGGGPVRCRIADTPEAGEFTVLPDLRAKGIRDYLVLPAPFTDGTTKAMTFATRRAEGFSDADVELLGAIMPMMAMILEVQTLRRTSRTFLDTYVGRQAASRVLDGSIKRGIGETIPCAILFCDLRGFTAISGTSDSATLLALLNDYFDVVTEAVHANQGEVLKFIGDAVLAVVAQDESRSEADSARHALDAARAAQKAFRAVNEARRAAGAAEIRCGMALHVGEVLYGNIGGQDRLDFTVIGPAVNLTSRVEKLCGELGEKVLMSERFADLVGVPARSVGRHRFKGVAEAQEVFAPA